MTTTTLKHLKFSNGERAILLVEQNGIPLFYPNLYITTQVRASSKALGTIKISAIALQVLQRWQSEFNVDLITRFQAGLFLQKFELDSLRDFCSKKVSLIRTNSKRANVVQLSKNSDFVIRNTQYQRMTVIAQYIGFLAITLNNKSLDEDVNIAIERMVKTFKKLRPAQQSRYKTEHLDQAIDDDVINRLYQVTQELHPDNPFSENVRFRNVLIIEILSALGLRKGELANIRLDDIDFQNNTLKVIRRPDETTDVRKHQPLVKTAERTLPISSHLGNSIQDYQLHHRSKFPAAKKHGYLFVSHKGTTEGLPLTISGIDYVFKRLKIATNDHTLSPHKLRHQWNYEFSKSVDSANERLSEAKEEQMRSYLMGWSPTSGMAANYNRRRIVENAQSAIKKHQSRLSKMKGDTNV